MKTKGEAFDQIKEQVAKIEPNIGLPEKVETSFNLGSRTFSKTVKKIVFGYTRTGKFLHVISH